MKFAGYEIGEMELQSIHDPWSGARTALLLNLACPMIAVAYELLAEVSGDYATVWPGGAGVTFRLTNATVAYEFVDFSTDDRFVIARRAYFDSWDWQAAS
jgi:hypothetical protein